MDASRRDLARGRRILAQKGMERRLSLGLTQQEVAERGGLTRQTVIRIENGDSVKTRSLYLYDRGLGWRGGTSEMIRESAAEPNVVYEYRDEDGRLVGREVTAGPVPMSPDVRRRELDELRHGVIASKDLTDDEKLDLLRRIDDADHMIANIERRVREPGDTDHQESREGQD